MKENPNASAKCIEALIAAVDERTGKEVQKLLDSLYESGYSQRQICEGLRTVLCNKTETKVN